MTRALLLVDLQHEFLERLGLMPSREVLCGVASRVLFASRKARIPIAHVRTTVSPRAGDCMPHWKLRENLPCCEGTRAVEAPAELGACTGEPVFTKRHYSAFSAPGLEEFLIQNGVVELDVIGVYLEACIRETVLDAYRRGYRVRVVREAVATTDALHAVVSQDWLGSRACRFVAAAEVLESGDSAPVWINRDPCLPSHELSRVELTDARGVEAAVRGAEAGLNGWRRLPRAERAHLLGVWADEIERSAEALVQCVVREIGKPLVDAREEIGRAVHHARVALSTFADPGVRPLAEGVWVRDAARGVVGLITPWNNPVAIPVGKLAPALLFGNTVVWKPSPRAPLTTKLVAGTLERAGVPADAVKVVFGAEATARALASHPAVSALAATGSLEMGRTLAALCARHDKPLQAELGGNNAAIVTASADLEMAAVLLSRSAFGFAGQRCTATRRLIVLEGARPRFLEAFVCASRSLEVGDPCRQTTVVGPMISVQARERLEATVEQARRDGARVIFGGSRPVHLGEGYWYEPTLLISPSSELSVVREETFGPIAVLLTARNFEEALRLNNAVPQGLVANLFSSQRAEQEEFLERAEAGILRINPKSLALCARAPFGGFKASGVGPPEHGAYDREFYARPQAVYAGVGDFL